jgi:tetratricopeptide (TPR) repeat protein
MRVQAPWRQLLSRRRIPDSRPDRSHARRARVAPGRSSTAGAARAAAARAGAAGLERPPDRRAVVGLAAAEALVALGRPDEAEAVLQQLEEQAVALRHRWATPASLRCRALLLLARERADDAADAADRAAQQFEELGFPLDRARSLLAAGAARRRAGQRRRAANTLQQAIEILCRGRARVDRRRRALAAVSRRRRGGDMLLLLHRSRTGRRRRRKRGGERRI